jgi:hypothetical protein
MRVSDRCKGLTPGRTHGQRANAYYSTKSKGSRLTSRSSLILFTHVASRTKNKGLPIDVPFYSYNFRRAPPCTKSKGLTIDVPFYSYAFYTCSTTYKKQWTPNQSIIVLFIHNHHRCMKSKVLYIYIYIYITIISQVLIKVILVQFHKLTISLL